MHLFSAPVLCLSTLALLFTGSEVLADVQVTATGLEPGTKATCVISGGGFKASDFTDTVDVDSKGNAVFKFDTTKIPTRNTKAEVTGTKKGASKTSTRSTKTWTRVRTNWYAKVIF